MQFGITPQQELPPTLLNTCEFKLMLVAKQNKCTPAINHLHVKHSRAGAERRFATTLSLKYHLLYGPCSHDNISTKAGAVDSQHVPFN